MIFTRIWPDGNYFKRKQKSENWAGKRKKRDTGNQRNGRIAQPRKDIGRGYNVRGDESLQVYIWLCSFLSFKEGFSIFVREICIAI